MIQQLRCITKRRRTTMSYLETIQELLEAKEGEHVQFKEAKR